MSFVADGEWHRNRVGFHISSRRMHAEPTLLLCPADPVMATPFVHLQPVWYSQQKIGRAFYCYTPPQNDLLRSTL